MSEPKTCRTCGRPITHKGRECYRCCAMKKATPKPCGYCGETFLSHPNYGTRCCGNSCRMRREMPSPSTSLNWAKCDLCQAWFIRRRGAIVCSEACRRERTAIRAAQAQGNTRRGTLVTTACKVCATEFTQVVITRLRDFCSTECVKLSPNKTKRKRNNELHQAAERRRRARKRQAGHDRYTSTEIFQRDNWLCSICGKPTSRTKRVPHHRAPTIDHIVPISKGGDDTKANVATAHFICNTRKGVGTVDRGEQLRLIG